MKLLIITLFSALIFLNPLYLKSSGLHTPINQSQKPLFSFGVIADVQYCDHDAVGTRFYRSSLSKLRNALNDLKSDSVNFVITLGDMIDRDYDSYKPVMDIIASSGIKTYHVTGNHDFGVKPELKKKLPVLDPSKRGYYSFVYKNIRMVFLNGNEISIYAPKNKSVIKKNADLIAGLKNKGEINVLSYNGGISNKQLNWLNKQLEEATKK